MDIHSIIIGTGSYIPKKIIPNSHFLENEFFDSRGIKFEKTNQEIVKTLEKVTGIKERRYLEEDQVTSDMAYEAAKDALESSDTDKESLDYIIVAHNFGDIRAGTTRSDFCPSLASRVKQKLEIEER